MGTIYARMGEKENAEKVISELIAKDQRSKNGSFKYAIASVYAALNEKALATEYLKQAFNEGYYFRVWRYYHDPLLIPLHSYPEYDEFVKFRLFDRNAPVSSAN